MNCTLFQTALTWVRAWWPTCAVTALILYAVLAPHPPSPPRAMLFEGADKVVHACMMATLTAAAACDRRRAGLAVGVRAMAAVSLWVMAFGVLTELMQAGLTEHRSGDAADVAADWAGTAAAAVVCLWMFARRGRSR